MKIIFCYTNVPDSRAEAAIRKYAPKAEFAKCEGLFGYNNIIAANWKGEEDLLVIEGDKEIHAEVVPSMEECNEDWCIYEYWNFPEPYQRNIIYGLGCTKYSARTQQLISTDEFLLCRSRRGCGYARTCKGLGCWRNLDVRIAIQVLAKCIRFAPHSHGRINHHHEYPADWEKQRGLE